MVCRDYWMVYMKKKKLLVVGGIKKLHGLNAWSKLLHNAVFVATRKVHDITKMS
jgi:hypothetical protein